MGFGIDIGGALKRAVSHASDIVHGAAKAVGDGVQAVEKKVADVVKSAVDGAHGNDGFDHGPVADSKPKGGSSSTYA